MSARAIVLDLNAFYYSDAFKTAATATSTRIFGDLALGLNIDKKGDWVLAWNVGYVSATDQSDSDTDTYTVTEMGPKFGFFFDKEHFWSLWVTYNMNVTGTVKLGADPTQTWRGTSIKAELGITPSIGQDLYAGIKLIYHSETFVESLEGSTNYEVIAYTRAFIYPSLNFSFRF